MFRGVFAKKSRSTKVLTIVCSLIIIVTTALTVLTFNANRQNNQVVYIPKPKDFTTRPVSPSSVSGSPIAIKSTAIDMDLSIIEGYYSQRTNSWTLTTDKAQFMSETTLPNNISGKTFIYGHYRNNVFASLPRLKNGDLVEIYTSNGYVFSYRLTNSYTTSPDDLSVIEDTKKPTLYLQTCSGFRFQKRQIFAFDFVAYRQTKTV